MPARTMPARREAAPKQETSTQPAKPTQPSDRRVDELLIRFRTGVTPQEQEAVLQWTGAQRQRLRGTSGVERLTFPAEQNVDTIAASLSNNPAVELVEPNYLIAADEVTPNDPRFNEQWALKKTGQTGGTTGGDLGVTEAWAQTTGSPATLIAVIDSGIDFHHPDFINPDGSSRLMYFWDTLAPHAGTPIAVTASTSRK